MSPYETVTIVLEPYCVDAAMLGIQLTSVKSLLQFTSQAVLRSGRFLIGSGSDF
jgi:hypothetical protein